MNKKKIITILLIIMFCILSIFIFFASNKAYNLKNKKQITKEAYQEKQYQQDKRDIVKIAKEKYNVPEKYVEEILEEIVIVKSASKKNKKPAEEEATWEDYERIFITNDRINTGVEFYKKFEKDIKRASEKFQVNHYAILGILGVETFFGKILGNYRAIDALFTLSVKSRRRHKFYKNELAALIKLIYDGNFDENIQGSYAGAIGYGQFMPTSLMEYSVDFNGNGKINTLEPVDAIGSVANYLKRHKWKMNAEYMYETKITRDIKDIDSKLWGHNNFNQSIEKWEKYGISALIYNKTKQKKQLTAYLFLLRNKKNKKYMLGLHNFRVVTRYNLNSMYATVVYILGQKISKKIKVKK